MNLNKLSSKDSLWFAVYGLALVVAALLTPLQVPEVLNIAWSTHFTWSEFWNWTSQSPEPSPVGSLVQLPFVLIFGPSRLGPRIPGLIFAVGSSFLFLQLAQKVVPRRRAVALLIFMLLPVQLLALTAATLYQVAVFFVLLTLIAFFELAATPTIKRSALFAGALAGSLFTDYHAGIPAFGAVLFLLRFSAHPVQRKAIWFSLPACVAAVTVYTPYFLWSVGRQNSFWLTEPGIALQSLAELTAINWALAAAVLLILAGVITGAVVSFRPPNQPRRALILFCLFGSVALPLAITVGAGLFTAAPIAPRDLLYLSPAAVLLFVVSLDWIAKDRPLVLPAAVAVLVLAICALADMRFIFSHKQNLALESRYVAPQLTSNSCVVFVSERYSRALFLVFQPELGSRECTNFFHRRIVLAVHPYVRPEQQADAEGYFRGLNFSEVKRIRSGGGEIVVMESNTK